MARPASSSARSSAKFSMMPLCTSATRPVRPRCGCALTSLGAPWVAQRVCPMPVVESGSGESAMAFSRLASLPARFSPGDRAAVDERDPGGVVAAVLQPPQPLDDHVLRVLFTDVPHDSAHGAPLYRCGTVPGRRRDGCNNLPHVSPRRWSERWSRRHRPRGVAVHRARPRRLGRARPGDREPPHAGGDPAAARPRRRPRPRGGPGGLPAAVAPAQHVRRVRRQPAPPAGGLPPPAHAPAHAVRDRPGRLGGGGQVDDRPRAAADARALAGAPQRRAGDHRRLPLPQRRARAPRAAAAQGLPGVLRPAGAAAVRRRHQVRQGRGRGADVLPPRLRRGPRREGRRSSGPTS